MTVRPFLEKLTYTNCNRKGGGGKGWAAYKPDTMSIIVHDHWPSQVYSSLTRGSCFHKLKKRHCVTKGKQWGWVHQRVTGKTCIECVYCVCRSTNLGALRLRHKITRRVYHIHMDWPVFPRFVAYWQAGHLPFVGWRCWNHNAQKTWLKKEVAP